MAPDLKLEIIYYKTSTDFPFEFNLGGCCNMRLLTDRTLDNKAFLLALARGVKRSQVILVVGELLGDEGLAPLIAKAVGRQMAEMEPEKFGILSEAPVVLPEGAMPLVSPEGQLGGCILESGPQVLILLTADKPLRHRLMDTLLHEYIADLSGKPANKRPASTVAPATETGSQTSAEPPIEAALESPAAPIDPDLEASTEENSEVAPEHETQTGEDSTPIHDVEAKMPTDAEPQAAHSETALSSTAEEMAAREDDKSAGQPGKTDEPGKIPAQGTEEDSEAETEDESEETEGRNSLKVFLTILIVLLLFTLGLLGYRYLFLPAQNDTTYRKAAEIHTETALFLTDAENAFDKLCAINPDTVGWITVAGTGVNHPVVTNIGHPQLKYYVNHNFSGTRGPFGTPYCTVNITADSYFRNLVIYGNDTGDGRMFSDLANLTNLESYRQSPNLIFDSRYSEETYKIISVFIDDGDLSIDYTTSGFFDDSTFGEFLQKIVDLSEIVTTVDILPSDEIITLVARGKGQNTVVVARKLRAQEDALVNVSDAVLRADYNGIPPVSSEASSLPESSSNPLTELSSEPTSSEDASSEPVSSTPPPVSSSETTTSTDTTAANITLRVYDSNSGRIVTGDAVSILAQVIQAEMGGSFHMEALKAQGVAAYSWLLYNGAASGSAPTLPLKSPNANSLAAAKAVVGQQATYNGETALTFFYAYSAGRSSNDSDVWNSNYPYLKSVDSSVDKNHPNFQTIRAYSASNIQKWVLAETGIDLSLVEDKNEWFHLTYDEAKLYVTSVRFGNDSRSYRGTFLRSDLLVSSRVGSDNTLKSHAYTITYDAGSDTFRFTVKGNGHCVGLSQYGANQYANRGWSYEQILQHYFPGITIVKDS